MQLCAVMTSAERAPSPTGDRSRSAAPRTPSATASGSWPPRARLYASTAWTSPWLVARQAGVGIATLFRRFPTREDLVDAVFADRMDAYADAVARPSPTPTPGTVSSATSKPSARCRPPTAASPTS